MNVPFDKAKRRARALLPRGGAILILLLPLALGSCGDLLGPSQPLSLHLEADVLAPGSEARLVMVNHGRREVQYQMLRRASVERKTVEGWEVATACIYGCGGLNLGISSLGGGRRVEMAFTIRSDWAAAGETYRIYVSAWRGERDLTPYTDEFTIEAAPPAAEPLIAPISWTQW